MAVYPTRRLENLVDCDSNTIRLLRQSILLRAGLLSTANRTTVGRACDFRWIMVMGTSNWLQLARLWAHQIVCLPEPGPVAWA